jgi:hypothetical protein
MTVPIKFVVKHADTYHLVRNLYKELDQTNKLEAREIVRQKIIDRLIEIFDDNVESI